LSRFVPAEDSLHSNLKKTCHTLLEFVSHFVSTTGIIQDDIDKVHALLQYLSSLLSLAFISGFISSSNIEIMKSEINYLHKHIEELSTRFASEMGQLHFKSDLFVVNQPKSEGKLKHEMSFKGSEVDKSKHEMSFKQIKKEIKIKTVKPAETKEFAKPLESKDDREKKILEVIQDKGIVSIKDISSVIFDVSEKTIQRTLQLLIDKGQIKKEGERRWAKYQLV
jgi:predicted transcriptional regulator